MPMSPREMIRLLHSKDLKKGLEQAILKQAGIK
jgi:predicted RNA binding protein YcfA (HicA-like mRNA interferase family)